MGDTFLFCFFAINLYSVAFGRVYEDCEVPPPVSYSIIRLEEAEDTMKAIYSCNSGYKLHGNTELICDFDTDEWSSDPPTCVLSETSNEIIDERKNPSADQEQSARMKKKKVTDIAEDRSISESFAASLDMSCVNAKIKAPPIRNGFVQRYERRKKGENVFLIAMYNCNDNYELEDPEKLSLYCSDKNWIGEIPVCISMGEYEEEAGETEADYDTYDETGADGEGEDGVVDNMVPNEEIQSAIPIEQKKEPHDESMTIKKEIINGDDDDSDKNGSAMENSVTDINIVVEPTRDPYTPRVLNQSCERSDDTTGCEHKCEVVLYPGENEPRFLCSCHLGFSLDPYDLRSCHDINECDSPDINERCAGGCDNEPGSFKCHSEVTTERAQEGEDNQEGHQQTTEKQEEKICLEGFRLDAITDQCVDVDECAEKTSECSEICINKEGGYECACQSEGYKLDNDKRSCVDVNECELPEKICSHECLNTLGSFDCICEANFHLLPDRKTCAIDTCSDLADPLLNKTRCSYDCIDSDEDETGNGGFRCICPPNHKLNSDGITCIPLPDACRDMGGNENCSPGSCVSKNENEEESGGRYQCLCPPGFTDNDGLHCNDIDECFIGTHECSHDCYNLEGTYRCSCPNGFQATMNDEHLCQDINECESMEACGVDLECVNVVGGFKCLCHGIETEPSSVCEMPNPCEKDMGGCSHSCVVTVDGMIAECQCPPDMILSDDRHNCTYRDICAINNNGCEHICDSQLGTCSCRVGYVLSMEDGRSCVDYDECSDNNGGCHQLCVNHPGSFACACEAGFGLQEDQRTCIDVDECSLGIHDCSHFCVNVIGGYECSCPSGYELGQNKLSCVDIDECAASERFCSHLCHNTLGSFHCECPEERFILDVDERTCLEVNVCKNLKPSCSHFCENTNETIDGYRCSCPEGMTLAMGDQFNCVDIDECEVDNGGCSHICLNNEKSYVCECPSGLKLLHDQRTCTDIDECLISNGGCSHYCRNLIGGFTCECDDGYHLKDSLTCEQNFDPCSENNGGCEQVCSSDRGNSDVAICSCRDGYAPGLFDLTHCEDIDECQVNNGGCEFQCRNTIGSFECSCAPGFTRSLANGECADVNECEFRNGGCIGGECINYEGGFKCKCPPGQKLSTSDGKSCIEVRDTCKALTPPENGEVQCTRFRHKKKLYYNTKCKVWCNPGYWLDGPSVRFCKSSGQWDYSENRCLPKICPKLPTPKFGVILPVTCTMGKSFMSERCRLQCLPGYVPIDKTVSVCTATQEWSTNESLDCIALTRPTSRQSIGSHYHYNHQNRKNLFDNGDVIRPFIKCPRNTTVYLGNDETMAHIILQKPITNLDFRYIESYPAWAKNLKAYLDAGVYTITFRGLDPTSGRRAKCRTVITVRKVEPPVVTFCPPSFEVILAPGEKYKAIFWDEPRFGDASSSAFKKIYKSQIPGSLFGPGVHRIYYEVTNKEDLSSRCEFNIVVKAAAPQLSQSWNLNFNYAHDPRSSSYKMHDFMKDQSFIICPGQDPVRVSPGNPLELPPKCKIGNIRTPIRHITRERHSTINSHWTNYKIV